MKGLSAKQTIFEYGWRLLLGAVLLLILKLSPEAGKMEVFFLIFLLFFLTLPGWAIYRLLKLDLEDFWTRFLVYFALGLSFFIVINLLAIFLGLNIQALIFIYYILLSLLFIVAFIKDYLSQGKFPGVLSLKDIFNKDNLIYLVPLIISFIIFVVASSRGADFNGDPYLHLSIIRKALGGEALTSQNLNFLKSATLNPSYAYPSWHILLAEIAKFTGLNIFTAWSLVVLPLTILAVISWHVFFKYLFNNRTIAAVALTLFLIFTFNNATGYFFQRLPVPDSLCQFILFPLIFGLTLKYIFDAKINKLFLIILGLLSIVLLSTHAIHYFYYLLGLIVFAILYLATKFREKGYKVTAWRFLEVFLATFVPFFLLAVLMEIKSHFISNTLANFQRAPFEEPKYRSFSKFEITFKYAYLLAPLILVFQRKNSRLLLLLSLMLLTPLVYWTPLKFTFSRLLSPICVDRLYGNVSLYFAVIGLVLGILLLIHDGWWVKARQNYRALMSALFGLLLVLLIIHQALTGKVFGFYRTYIYSYNNRIFIDAHAWTILIIMLIITAALIFWTYWQPKIMDNFKKEAVTLPTLLLFVIIAFIFLSPTYVDLGKYFSGKDLFSRRDFTSVAINPKDYNNDEKAISSIQNLPPKSMILADPTVTKPISMLADVYMAYNLKSGTEKELNSLYSTAVSDTEKEGIVRKYQIDYVFLEDPNNQDVGYFAGATDLYKRIYDNQTQIYKVIR